jgi:hypothetical protein
MELILILTLEVYGSTWPGSRGYVDDIDGEKKDEKGKRCHEKGD